jgi:hypothetical protein
MKRKNILFSLKKKLKGKEYYTLFILDPDSHPDLHLDLDLAKMLDTDLV